MNCFVSFLSSTSLILWFYDWCLSSVFWSLSFSNRILYFLNSLEIIVITRFRRWLLWISLLHKICASLISLNSSRISSLVMTNIFTSCDNLNIECNRVTSVSRNVIVSLTQLIIKLIIWSHDMSRTISLPDCFVTFKRNFSQCHSILKWMSWVSWSISSLLYFMNVSLKFCRL